MPDITIPAAAIEAGARAAHELMGKNLKDYMYVMGLETTWVPYDGLNPERKRDLLSEARAACVAMLTAWPEMTTKQPNEHVALFNSDPAIILPLTENPDDKA